MASSLSSSLADLGILSSFRNTPYPLLNDSATTSAPTSATTDWKRSYSDIRERFLQLQISTNREHVTDQIVLHDLTSRIKQTDSSMQAMQEELLRLRPIAASAKKSVRPPTDSSNTGLSRLLCAFLPNMVVAHVNKGDFEMAPHFSLHPNSTLLFVDICGYTALAQKLGSEGTQGTEKLSQSLDAFFNRAITSIYKHGGDVIKFCGDALMCTFSTR